jgi:hypothetical protein
MAVQDVVTVLTEYCEDGEETFRDLHGSEAVATIKDVIELLEDGLRDQLEYDALWEDFTAAPRETSPDLVGALEAMVEANPSLGEGLEALLDEYYATNRPVDPAVGTSAPASIPPEDVPIKDHEVEPRSHTDVAGEGTYLYGNVRAGEEITVEAGPELSPDVLEVRRELETLSFDVRDLFEQLRVTMGREPALDEETRRELRQALEALEAEVMLGEEADEDRIVEHLRRVGALDLDFLGLVLTGLRHTRSEAQYIVQSAIERATT